jgi:hypothetical protein
MEGYPFEKIIAFQFAALHGYLTQKEASSQQDIEIKNIEIEDSNLISEDDEKRV